MTALKIDRREWLATAGAVLVAVAASAAPGPARASGFRVVRTPAEWKRLLGPARYAVLREAATERPGSSPLLREHRNGVFGCAGCAQPLFASATKFESGTGWPSFWKALPGGTLNRTDRSLMMQRTEVLCARCGGHLGHLFDDGPKPTGLRYCMNGLALRFRPA